MNTRNEIKITFGTPKYVIYGNFTKCYLPFTVKIPPILETIAEALIAKGYALKLPKSAKGFATVHQGDEYNENTGIKVSTAKAEIAAYTIVNNWFVDLATVLFESAHCKIDDFMIKADKVIQHDVKYIEKF